MKKFCYLLCGFLVLCSVLSACNDEVENLTGYVVFSGTYVKTSLNHDVLIFKTDAGEEMYVFMTLAEGSQASFDGLQTGDKIIVSFVEIKEKAGVNTTQVFELEKDGVCEFSISADTWSRVEILSQKLLDADITENDA